MQEVVSGSSIIVVRMQFSCSALHLSSSSRATCLHVGFRALALGAGTSEHTPSLLTLNQRRAVPTGVRLPLKPGQGARWRIQYPMTLSVRRDIIHTSSSASAGSAASGVKDIEPFVHQLGRREFALPYVATTSPATFLGCAAKVGVYNPSYWSSPSQQNV